MWWEIPELWKGDTCYIVGGGPSVNDVDLDRLRGQNVIVTNSAFEDCPWAPVLFFMDGNWEAKNRDKLYDFPGLIVTIKRTYEKSKRIRFVHPSPSAYIEWRPAYMNYASNSGLCSLLLALRFGCSKAILFGFDCRVVSGKMNYHTRYDSHPEASIFNKFKKDFDEKAPLIQQYMEVVNATPSTALDCFPVCSPEEVYP